MDRWSGSDEAEMVTLAAPLPVDRMCIIGRPASLPVDMLSGTCIGMAVGTDHAP